MLLSISRWLHLLHLEYFPTIPFLEELQKFRSFFWCKQRSLKQKNLKARKKTFTRRPILCDSFYRLEVSIMARLLRSIVWQARFSWPLINNFKAPSRSMQNNNLCSWPPPAPYFYNSLSSITKKSMTLFSRKIDK